MQFIDEATIHVRGGSGGAGALHWHRAKYVPKGGPDGGNGGTGGAVILEAVPNLNTLVDHVYEPHIRAGDGLPGGENLKTGADGHHKVVAVPVGTQVFFGDKMVADLSKPGSRWVAARGGMGGKGNTHFKSSTNQSPNHSQPGVAGEERTYRLVLKSVADVGLVGLPNAGKSTFISSVSGAKPKVASYPFTTLRPELGVVLLSEGRRFVLADIPGIIEGAHEGKGLGLTFLKHIERTKALVFVIDITQCTSYALLQERIGEDIEDSFFEGLIQETIDQITLLKTELESHLASLLSYPSFLLFTKSDYLLVPEIFTKLLESNKVKDVMILCSSHTKKNLKDACEMMGNLIFSKIKE
jgi:GTPase